MCQVNVSKQIEQLEWVALNSLAVSKNLAHLRTRVSHSESIVKAKNKARGIVKAWNAGTLSVEHMLTELGCMICHILAYDSASMVFEEPSVTEAFQVYCDIMRCDGISSFELITLANFSDLFHRVNRCFLEG